MGHRLWQLAFALLVVVTSSCGPLRSPLALGPEQRELPSSDLVQEFPVDHVTITMPSRWWESFGSEELNALMAQAFADNLSVAGAWARLRQARATARIAGSEGKIQLNGKGDTGTTRTDRRGSATGGTKTTNSLSAGLALSLELDLWGRIGASSRAAELTAVATEKDVQATALALSGQLTSAWLELRATRLELTVLSAQIDTSRKSLELLEGRQRKAMSALVDVLQQRQQVASLESAVPQLQGSIALQKIRIAYLLGKPADVELELLPEDLPRLPPIPSIGLPSELLANRPDVQAAWRRLEAQEWTVAAARANRLPTLSLAGAGTLSAPKLADLFDTWVTTLAASLTAPISDGGRRRADVARNRALADERFIAYRDTVLTALGEVTEALTQESWQSEHLSRLQVEAEIATRTLEETQRRYRNGVTDYLPVLTALSSQQRTERALVAARSSLLINRVALCQALGGTWMNDLTAAE